MPHERGIDRVYNHKIDNKGRDKAFYHLFFFLWMADSYPVIAWPSRIPPLAKQGNAKKEEMMQKMLHPCQKQALYFPGQRRYFCAWN